MPWLAASSISRAASSTCRAVTPGGHALVSIEVIHGGTGFTTAPTGTITGGGGPGATATATVSGGAVTAITITNAGTGYTSNPVIALSYGGAANVLLAAHFGTETEYLGGTRPATAIPVGYVPTQQSTWLLAGDTGAGDWRYFELPVPSSDGTTTIENIRAFCRGCT